MAARASLTSSLHQPLLKLEEQLTCPVCLDSFTDPRTLPCLHSFCKHCLFGMSQTSLRSIVCPTCRHRTELPKPVGVAGFPVAFHLNNLKEIHINLMKKVVSRNSIICDNCAMANDISYCKECGQFFCQSCIDDHVATNHDFASLVEAPMSLSQVLPAKQEVCSLHRKVFDMYCETCREVICLECKRTTHSYHKCDGISESYLRHCQNLESGLNVVDENVEAFTHVLEAHTKKEEEVKEQSEVAKAEICMMVEGMVNILYESRRKLTEEIETATDSKLKVLSEQKKSTKATLRQLKDCKSIVKQCLQIGTLQQVLISMKQMMNRVDHVIEQNVEEFYPTEQPNIEFIKNSELADTLEHIGEVVSTDVLQQCKVKRIVQHQCLPEEETISFHLSVELPDSTPFAVPVSSLSCYVTPPDKTESDVIAVITATPQAGVYQVQFSPVIYGYHDLSIKINDVELENLSIAIPSNLHFANLPHPIRVMNDFEYPYGVAINASGQVIVTEPNNHCLRILDRDMKRVKSFGGEEGSSDIELSYPRGVTITPDNFILVTNDHKILKLTVNGVCVSSVGEEGNGPQEFNGPDGVAASHITGYVYVADRGNHRIQVLTSDLTFFHSFGSEGSAEGQFDEPWDTAVDSEGLLYVTDSKNHRIQKFTADGSFIAQFGNDKLITPAGIAISHINQVYITDWDSHCIFVFNTEGQLVKSFGAYGSSESDFYRPGGIDFNGEGLLYVCDYFNKGLWFIDHWFINCQEPTSHRELTSFWS